MLVCRYSPARAARRRRRVDDDEAMRFTLVLACFVTLSGCLFVGDDDEGGRDGEWSDFADDEAGDDGDQPDAGPSGTPACGEPATGDTSVVRVSGQVVDYASGEPIAGAEVAINVAWDAANPFPSECAPLDTFTTDDDGRFGPADVDLRVLQYLPIVLLRVTGDEIAPTASDQRVDCGLDGLDCGDLAHTIAAPSRDVVAAWREELTAGGMPDVDDRGLVAFEFRNPDATPASDVIPWIGLIGEDALEPGTQVRFLEADRATLTPPDTAATTAGGVALIGLEPEDAVDDGFDSEDAADFIRGTRLSDGWDETGVITAPGWVFLEDKQQTP
jgi:hypothetical protein